MAEHDGYNRRKTDRRIDKLERNLRKMVDDMFAHHIEESHIKLTAAEALEKVAEHDRMVESMDRVAILLEGKPIYDLSQNIVGHRGGMIAKQTEMASHIDTIYERTNGGVTVTYKPKWQTPKEWTRGNKIAAVGVGSAAFFAALPGVVGFFHFLAEWWVL